MSSFMSKRLCKLRNRSIHVTTLGHDRLPLAQIARITSGFHGHTTGTSLGMRAHGRRCMLS
eukprot:scaffold82054_cov28-Tisochrysis_lutea.AAC.4